MTEELKKSIELLKERADSLVHMCSGSLSQDEEEINENNEAVALISSALSTDKTLEVVKRFRNDVIKRLPNSNGFDRKKYQLVIDWFNDVVECVESNSFNNIELDAIIAEIEGDK